ncbi:MAG: glycosyltransferase [Actinomycetaceae bacterium]|nr:glycosyltransferase [Actinomycetaceae bacterium]
MSGAKPKVVTVVVAWNRQHLLVETLNGLNQQQVRPDAVVVIDNASTDDSAAIAKQHPVVTEVLTMPRNLGGAGGFAAGIARAVHTHAADLVWIMDDDTIPTPGALSALLEARENYPGQVALLASKAIWIDGREHPMNRPRLRPLLCPVLRKHAEQIHTQPVRTASFVSIMMDSRAIRETGLPQADFFLWNDDFEYTARMLRNRIGLYVPASIVEHRTKVFGDSSADPGPRFVNETRNKVWTFTRSDALNPLELLLYGGRSVLRWGQTIAGSESRTELLRYGVEGVKEGLRPPLPTMEILADTPVAADARAVLENHKDHYLRNPQGCGGTGGEVSEDSPFSVLMSVYAGDHPQHFKRALQSVSCQQTRRPNHIVLVQDGPVGADLQKQIDRACQIAEQPVEVVRLDQNQGLTAALNQGLKRCPDPVIARADADDISLPERFEHQLPLMRKYDLVGTAIAEFEYDENTWGMIRVHPSEHRQIVKTAKFRDPFNHPSVMMRRSCVDAAGGYRECGKMEDYWLFVRMIMSGARCANLPQPLVAYRVGAGAYQRRGGKELWESELELQRKMRQSGFTTEAEYVRNLLVRASYRWVPTAVRRVTYTTIGSIWWFRSR